MLREIDLSLLVDKGRLMVRLIVFVLFLFNSTLAFSASNEEGLLRKLPSAMHGFSSEGIEAYGDARYGASATYQLIEGHARATLTVIMFDGGFGPVADGVESEVTEAAFKGAINDIRAHEKMGRYQDVKVISSRVVEMADREGYIANVNYKFVQDSFEKIDVNSYLVVTGVRNYILKIRVTGDASSITEPKILNVVESIVFSIDG